MKTYYQTDAEGILLHAFNAEHAPAGAVLVAPPEQQAALLYRWESTVPLAAAEFGLAGYGHWATLQDLSKAALYLTTNGAPYQAGTMLEQGSYPGYGPLPAWLTDIPRPSAFHRWEGDAWVVDAAARFSAAKDAKLRELDAARDDALAAGFSHQGVRYDSDPKSRQRIAALLSVSLADAGFSTPYITADNTVVTLGAVALAGLASAAAQHESTLVFQARALKDQVLVATTVEAIEQIAWSPIQA